MPPRDELHGFIEQLQEAVGLLDVDSESTTAQRLLALEGTLPATAVQPDAFMVRALIALHLTRLAHRLGLHVLAAVAPRLVDLHAADAERLRGAYRAAVLPIVDLLQSAPHAVGAYVEPRVSAALQQIRQCATLSRALHVEDVARVCHVSKWHLERLLRRHTGLTFKQHVRSVRLDAARRLLVAPELTMKEIAARTGYLYETEFCRDFKAVFGVTPTAWRKGGVFGQTLPPALLSRMRPARRESRKGA